MPLTVLSDAEVQRILHGLTKADVLDLQQSLADALHYYSTTTEADQNGCCSSYQPLRTSLKRSDGQTTLFMPASSNEGIGVKIVTLAVPATSSDAASTATPESGSRRAANSSDETSAPSISSSTTVSGTPTASSSASTRTTTTNAAQTTNTRPKGSITLLDSTGAPRGFLNAEEVTAFRTALAATMMFKKRHTVHNVVVFGAGKQAYWHIRLALLLRGSDIHHLTIVNRSYETGQKLLYSLFGTSSSGEEQEGGGGKGGKDYPITPLHRPKIQILTPAAQEYQRLLKSAIRASHVIFTTTPSLTPLFPASYLTSPEGRKRGRYVSAIGSYKPHMCELDPEILKEAVKPEHGGTHWHKHAKRGGAVVVDSVEACLREAGEVIQAGLGGREVVELGELIMLRREAEKRREETRMERLSLKKAEKTKGEGEEDGGWDESGVEVGACKKGKWYKKIIGVDKDGKHAERHEDEENAAGRGLREWLQKGNVVYKSVGLGLMDVVVGGDVVRLADQMGVGTRIADF